MNPTRKSTSSSSDSSTKRQRSTSPPPLETPLSAELLRPAPKYEIDWVMTDFRIIPDDPMEEEDPYPSPAHSSKQIKQEEDPVVEATPAGNKPEIDWVVVVHIIYDDDFYDESESDSWGPMYPRGVSSEEWSGDHGKWDPPCGDDEVDSGDVGAPPPPPAPEIVRDDGPWVSSEEGPSEPSMCPTLEEIFSHQRLAVLDALTPPDMMRKLQENP